MEASVSGEVVNALRRRFGEVVKVGAGAWSTAFRFERDDDSLVVRVGEHFSDFEIDAEMSKYSSAAMPIPNVIELGQLDPPNQHLNICVSRFAHGTPLEAASPTEWAALVPKVADLFDALQSVEPPSTVPVTPWPDLLLTRDDDGDGRLTRWRERLAAHPDLLVGYEQSMEQLRERCTNPSVIDVKPTLLHCDLINRNVHVDGNRIAGVFDWGCRRWGDHLYDLAWFQFWQPWHLNLDIELLSVELSKRWGHEPDEDRLAACLLHIGADHIVWNAVIDDAATGRDVLNRMRDLGLVG